MHLASKLDIRIWFCCNYPRLHTYGLQKSYKFNRDERQHAYNTRLIGRSSLDSYHAVGTAAGEMN